MAEVANILSKKYSNKIIYLSDKEEGETLPFMSIDKLHNGFGEINFTELGEII